MNVVLYFMLDLRTLKWTDIAPIGFPGFQGGMKVTYDPNFVYLFGGNFDNPEVPVDGIIRLNLITGSWDFLPVQDFPTDSQSSFDSAPEVVWVEKQNRIYMFGGALRLANGSHVPLDGIWYIDMNPTIPTTTLLIPTTTEEIEEPSTTTINSDIFSCDSRTDGTHPHHSDCSKYIACRNGTLEGIHPCSPPLLYDPILLTCNLPSLVNCDLNCEDKEDGIHQHPNECRLFLICSNRDLFVFWCDAPLLFDPQELKCDLPELVNCANF